MWIQVDICGDLSSEACTCHPQEWWIHNQRTYVPPVVFETGLSMGLGRIMDASHLWGPRAGLREFYQAHHKDETKESAALRSKMDAAKVTLGPSAQVLSENGGITP